MLGKWYQLYVKAPEGIGYTNPQAMKRIDDHLVSRTPSSFVAKPPEGMPVQQEDGTWEVRVLDESALSFVKFILTDHYGLEIIREVENE